MGRADRGVVSAGRPHAQILQRVALFRIVDGVHRAAIEVERHGAKEVARRGWRVQGVQDAPPDAAQ